MPRREQRQLAVLRQRVAKWWCASRLYHAAITAAATITDLTSKSFNSAVHAADRPTGAARPIDLFGILVETIEDMVDENEVLRKHLHKEYLQRRGSAVARKLAVLTSDVSTRQVLGGPLQV